MTTRLESAEPINLYWWKGTKNFGDLIGPWMVEMLTGRPVVNIKGRKTPTSVVGLATAGSLIASLDRPGLDIWGSGSIRPISKARAAWLAERRPRAIHALRGRKTRWHVVKKLGWEAPKVFGDPAVLLPRLYSPRSRPDAAGKTAIVAHYIHKATLGALDRERFHWVEVQDDPDAVVDQIATADRVISSSLHGVIVAHAYGVPWTWLTVADQPLGGGAFKFEDHFTTMNRDAVSEAVIAPDEVSDAAFARMADAAALPGWTISHDPLWDAFPYHR